MNINFRQLETFRLFARTQSVTETARLLRVSQPAVSQTLKDLEGQFGFALFVRTNGRTRLTTEANNVLPDVERMFAQMASLKGKAAELRDTQAGSLSIASVPSFTNDLLPTALKAFRSERQNVAVRLEIHSASDVVRQVRQEYCDVGFAFLPFDEAGVAAQPLMRMSMICLVPRDHRLASHTVITAADLVGETIIAHGAQTTPGILLREGLRAEVGQFMMLTTNQSMASMHLVQHGLGIAFAHPLILPFDHRDVVAAIPYELEVPLTFAMMYSRNRPVPRLLMRFEAVLRKILSAYCDEMRAKGFALEKLI
ncbi:LysR family transcriptional regulator [Rhizobium sp. CC-YZS058]|uniref:LysR family transcriptional regulator n=1 Tax=Rhizobium sp. CC-YZS058 TaxID=3042153 RepID=UPI002B05E58F|nr:LysR family transcriptional regulator [Rhizobium sp. CC-YZS058]MEA3535878.1 LysR family transcriptional regulator [Rhizobium sp. CC-YZS058]